MNQMQLDLKLTLQSPYFEMWLGIRAMYGLDEDFLNHMANQVIRQALISMMTESNFGE